MKRVVLILSCISVFYAGAVWALEGCRDIGAGHELFHPAVSAASDHDNDAASHHSHSDPTKIHCPNVFGEFLVSSRVTLTADHSYFHHHVALAEKSVHDFLSDMIFGGFGGGPPGPLHSKTFPRHLLLSVIRI